MTGSSRRLSASPLEGGTRRPICASVPCSRSKTDDQMRPVVPRETLQVVVKLTEPRRWPRTRTICCSPTGHCSLPDDPSVDCRSRRPTLSVYHSSKILWTPSSVFCRSSLGVSVDSDQWECPWWFITESVVLYRPSL